MCIFYQNKIEFDWDLMNLEFGTFSFRNNVNEVVFIPYAKVNGDYDGYTKMMGDAIANLSKKT